MAEIISKLRHSIISAIRKFDIYSLYLLKIRGPLHDDGWFRSFREQAAIDASGAPLPWITYPAIEFIQTRIKRTMTVFEYGSGGSTTWWANRVSEVISIEHDRAWYNHINKTLKTNVELHHINLIYNGDYSNKILEYSDYFDVIVIDGRDRVNCMKNCVTALKPAGIVILDNSDRPEYIEGVDFLISHGFKKIEFIGFCPIVNIKSETSILYRTLNVFGI